MFSLAPALGGQTAASRCSVGPLAWVALSRHRPGDLSSAARPPVPPGRGGLVRSIPTLLHFSVGRWRAGQRLPLAARGVAVFSPPAWLRVRCASSGARHRGVRGRFNWLWCSASTVYFHMSTRPRLFPDELAGTALWSLYYAALHLGPWLRTLIQENPRRLSSASLPRGGQPRNAHSPLRPAPLGSTPAREVTTPQGVCFPDARPLMQKQNPRAP